MQRTIRTIVEEQDIVTASAQTSVSDAARMMKARGVGAMLVLEGERLVGIFTERDGLYRVVAANRDARRTTLAEVMTPNPQTVHPDEPFPHALHMMHAGGFRHVPVVDQGKPIGMVSARDALGPELEDFVYALLRQEQLHNILA
ncbi:MAG: CBS domain-containing protein [Burkholderiales bacterium]|nr:CBS domain-containing protein [Burkholderiales bacterium]